VKEYTLFNADSSWGWDRPGSYDVPTAYRWYMMNRPMAHFMSAILLEDENPVGIVSPTIKSGQVGADGT
jgi:hypothetical protein